MKYKILTRSRNRWGEGWQYGDIVELDFEAARVALINKEIEPVTEYREEVVEEEKKTPIVEDSEQSELTCKVCGKVCKNKLGLGAHLRSHK